MKYHLYDVTFFINLPILKKWAMALCLGLLLTITGAAQTDYALRFDGVNDNITIPNGVAANFTLEARIRTTANSKTGTYAFEGSLIFSADVGGVYNDYSFSILNNKLAFDNGSSGASGVIGRTILNDGAWHTVAMSRTAGSPGTTNLYVDGVLDGTGNAGSAALTDNPTLTIGGTNGYFNGYMDEIRVWNTARSITQIRDNMSSSLVGNETGLYKYLKLNEGTGTVATNLVSGQTNGTLNNFDPTTATSAVSASGWVFVTCNPANLLLNPSFESPSFPVSTQITLNPGCHGENWTVNVNNGFNIIRVNGTSYGNGPDNASSGTQYIDIASAAGKLSQSFTLTSQTGISFEGYFANREAGNSSFVAWQGYIEILNASNAVVATSNTISMTAALRDDNWFRSSGNVTALLPAGTYTYRATVGDFGHFDNASVFVNPYVTGTGTAACSGTISATAFGVPSPYTYNFNGGTYQSSPTFLNTGANTYALNAKSNTGCVFTTSVVVPAYPASTDNPNAAGANTWIGHMYSGTSFTSYIGQYTETETFNESFGGSAVCFNVVSNTVTRSIYSELFSTRFRMASSKRGLYTADLGADDGSRLTVDSVLIYNNYSAQGFTGMPTVLMTLTGTSALLYEYYDNGGANQVQFQNLTLLLANTLSSNTTQNICTGSSGSAISGDVYATLPSGITLSGTGYQWSYSTTPSGARTNISGATGATFIPSGSVTPFNTAGTYYVYRKAILSSTKNVNPNPYVATSESNAATITVVASPSATIKYAGDSVCSSSETKAVTQTGTTGGTYSSTIGLTINASTGTLTPTSSRAGTYLVTYTVAATTGCAVYSTTTSVTITVQPYTTGTYAGTPYCYQEGTVYPGGIFQGAYPTITSTAGLSINTTNGNVNLGASTVGSYVVTYTVNASGGCALYSYTTPITITAKPSATISYAGTPYCKSAGTATVTQTGTTGGTYSSTTGLTINSSNGTITLSSSTAGNYTVTYIIPAAGGCAADTVTTPVSIVPAPSATIGYAGSPYCFNAGFVSATQTGTTGGTYSSTAGLSINVASGVINTSRSTPGTYTVTYSIGATGGCSGFSTTASITLTPAPSLWQFPFNNLITYYRFEGDALDVGDNNKGTLQNSPATTTDRFNIAGEAYLFNGSTQYVSTANAYDNPNDFTISIWFKTTSVNGGRLIGFGSTQIGISSSYDRHIYMSNDGRIYFGVFPNSVQTVNSSLAYNDGNWHMATASLSSTAGMVLYIDGAQIGINTFATSAQVYTGYWKIGYDNMGSWTNQPRNSYFNGSLDDAFIYQRILTPAEVVVLYKSAEGAGNNGPVCAGSTITLSATSVNSATYAWSGPGGFSSTLQNPSFAYTVATAGTYQVQVTLGSCTASAYTNVVSSAVSGQWNGNTSSDWANGQNWCSGVVPDSSSNVIIAAGVANMPVISSSASCNNLTVNSGATVTIAAAGTLNISGLLTNNGTYTDNGTTDFSGKNGQQTFSGVATFNNLTLSNSSGLLLPNGLTVKNNVTITNGILNSNNYGMAIAGNWYNNSSVTAFTAGTSTIIFNSSSAKVIGGTYSTSFNNLSLTSTGSTVSLQANISVASNLVVTSGTFDLGTFTANGSAAGSTISVSTNATLKIGGTNTFPAGYTSTNLLLASTVEYSGTNQTVANFTYGNLALSSSAGAVVKTLPGTALTVLGNFNSTTGNGTAVSFTAASNITIHGNVTIGAATTFNGGSYIDSIGGNWVNNGTFNGNTGTVTFEGAGSSVSGPGAQNFNNLNVAASLVTFSATSLSVSGNLATTGSGSFTQAPGGTVLMTGTGATISGTGISLNNLTVSGTVSTNSSLVLSGNLAVSGGFAAQSGTISMSGTSKVISGTGTKAFGILSVTGSITTDANFSISSGIAVNTSGSLLASAGTATFSGVASLNGTANLYNTTLTGSSLQLSASAVLGIANLLTITSGTLNVDSSGPNTVNFNGPGAQTVNAIRYSNLYLSNSGTKTAAGAITTAFDINIGTGTTFNPSSYTHSIYGNWVNNGTFTAGTSTIQFLGPATAYITGATTFNILTSNGETTTTDLFLNSNVSASIVNMTMGTIRTGTSTLTITNTRTGEGNIYGIIQRTNAFTTGVAYAFKNPYNTITFASVAGVTSITVIITDKFISDFPFGSAINAEDDVTIPAGTYNATYSMNYEEDELNGNDESTMTLWRYNGSAWVSAGKSANNTTTNYVAQSGLTNITGRWTASGAINRIQWMGTVSTDWNNPLNWNAVSGSPSSPPSASDVVDLGTAAFTNQPTINTAAFTKNIHFGSTQPVILTLTSGGSLTTSGNIDGLWSANATHTINVNGQDLIVKGDLNLGDGINDRSINLIIGSGTISVGVSLFQSGNAAINFTGAGTLNIAENFNYSSGLFSAGTGTVVYNGDENQHVAHLNYNNLTINKAAAIASMDSITRIGGNLLLVSGQLDNYTTTTIIGNVTINTGTIFNNHLSLHVQGNWNNNGNYVGTGSSIFFEGGNSQSISASTFNNLNINKPVGTTATLTGDVVITGDFIVTSGTLDVKTFTNSRNVPGGTHLLANAGTLIIGANNPPLNFTYSTVEDSSTVIFNGLAEQTLFLPTNFAFGNVIFRNAGLKTLLSPALIKGNVTIESGANFNAGAQTVTVNGNWINNGTFTPSTSTVIFSGTDKTISGVNTFNNNIYTGSYTTLNDYTVNGQETNTETGSITAGAGRTLTYNGDVLAQGTIANSGTGIFTGLRKQTITAISSTTFVGTVIYNGSVSPVFNTTSSPIFGNMIINNTGGVSPAEGWTILTSLVVGNGGIFNGGISTHNIQGNLTNNGTITSSGSLNFVPPSAVTVNLGNNFKSTGIVVLGGAGLMTLAGANDSMNVVVVSNTNPAGITPAANWIMANNFTINPSSIFNAGSYTYSVGGNLYNRGSINRGTSTFIVNGSMGQDISSTSPFNNLTINNTHDSVTLSSSIAVYGALNFIKGSIQTGIDTVYSPLSGSVTGGAQSTGWVNGNLQKSIVAGSNISQTFEVGDSVSYSPVTTLFASVSTGGTLTAKATGTDHPQLLTAEMNVNKTVNRYYKITNAGTAFTTASATFNWVAADVDAGATPAYFRIKSYNGSIWTLLANVSPLATSNTAAGITGFGDFAIGELTTASWAGAVDTDWFKAGNWSGGVPTNTSNVVIPRGLAYYPVLLTGTGTVQNITIDTGASVILNGGTLEINGLIRNGGTFSAGNGTVMMNSNGAQSIPAGTFTGNALNNLTISNSSNVTLEGPLAVGGILKVSTGSLQSGGFLTLLSTATRTALIDGSGGGPVLGNVTMQRYVPSGFGYKYFSSPFQAARVSQLANEINLAAAFPLLYRYDEAQVSSGWLKYVDTSALLNPAQGYSGNFGDSASGTTSKTIDIKGVVNNGAISAGPLVNHNNFFTRGYNLVGNPYPSPIDWNLAAGFTRTNIDNAVYYFNNGSTNQYTGTYGSYVNGVSGDGVANNFIAAMQGFFVHVTDGSFPVSGALAFNNGARVNNLVPNFHRVMAINPPLVRLRAGYADESTVTDPVVVYFDSSSNGAFNKELDALKLMNTDVLVPNLYAISSDSIRLSIYAWPWFSDTTERIPLGLNLSHAGNITFSAYDLERIPANRLVYLYDNITGSRQDLRSNPVYRIKLDAGTTDRRFFLEFRSYSSLAITPVSNVTPLTTSYRIFNNGVNLYAQLTNVPGAKCQVSVTNRLGQVLLRKQLNGNGLHDLGSGYINGIYIVTFYTPHQQTSKKIFVAN